MGAPNANVPMGQWHNSEATILYEFKDSKWEFLKDEDILNPKKDGAKERGLDFPIVYFSIFDIFCSLLK